MVSFILGTAFGLLFTLIAVLYREMEKERRQIIQESRINLRNIR